MSSRRTFLYQLGFSSAALGMLSYLSACGRGEPGPLSPVELSRSSPEAQGVASRRITRLLQAIKSSGIEFHSLMILRHGTVITEGWWAPYAPDYKHTLYSLSKSFTSSAIGIAISEGLLQLDDPVISFFPEDLPEDPADFLQAMTVRHLLTMNTGHETDSFSNLRGTDASWVQTFLAEPIPQEPGTHFLYDTGATFMLAAILEKVSGESLLDYLQTRLLDPMGISGVDWERSPGGICKGGTGLRVKTEDIAKLGQLYLQGGKWGEKQLIPADWVAEATRKQTPSQEGDHDWSQGYGYKFWINKSAGYRGDGAFGQYCIVLPEQDAVVAITSESFDMQASMDLIWEYLLPYLREAEALPEAPDELAELTEALATLALPTPPGRERAEVIPAIFGMRFRALEEGSIFSSVELNQDEAGVSLTFEKGGRETTLTIGQGEWKLHEGLATDSLSNGSGRDAVSSLFAVQGGWESSTVFQVHLRYVETAHSDVWRLQFQDDRLRINFLHSVAAGRGVADARPEWEGVAASE